MRLAGTGAPLPLGGLFPGTILGRNNFSIDESHEAKDSLAHAAGASTVSVRRSRPYARRRLHAVLCAGKPARRINIRHSPSCGPPWKLPLDLASPAVTADPHGYHPHWYPHRLRARPPGAVPSCLRQVGAQEPACQAGHTCGVCLCVYEPRCAASGLSCLCLAASSSPACCAQIALLLHTPRRQLKATLWGAMRRKNEVADHHAQQRQQHGWGGAL